MHVFFRVYDARLYGNLHVYSVHIHVCMCVNVCKCVFAKHLRTRKAIQISKAMVVSSLSSVTRIKCITDTCISAGNSYMYFTIQYYTQVILIHLINDLEQ